MEAVCCTKSFARSISTDKSGPERQPFRRNLLSSRSRPYRGSGLRRLRLLSETEKTHVVFRESACLFCGSSDVTEEHLIAAWVFRAVQQTRKPKINVIRTNRSTGQSVDRYGIQQDTAEVSCRSCNNGWMSRLDNAAAEVLKPLLRANAPVNLSEKQQIAVAAWCLKTVMVNDLPLTGGQSLLREYAPRLMQDGQPPEFIEIWHGPPSLSPTDGFAMVGVLPNDGTLVLGSGPDAERVPLRSWSLMLGYCDLYMRPLFRWIPLESPPVEFQRIWPIQHEHVRIVPKFETLLNTTDCVPRPHRHWIGKDPEVAS